MGSADGILFHLKATHLRGNDLTGEWLEERVKEAMDGWGLNRMTALARIHQAFHASDAAIRDSKGTNGDGTCDNCHERPAVVVLTQGRYCAPCALTRQTPA